MHILITNYALMGWEISLHGVMWLLGFLVCRVFPVLVNKPKRLIDEQISCYRPYRQREKKNLVWWMGTLKRKLVQEVRDLLETLLLHIWRSVNANWKREKKHSSTNNKGIPKAFPLGVAIWENLRHWMAPETPEGKDSGTVRTIWITCGMIKLYRWEWGQRHSGVMDSYPVLIPTGKSSVL